MRTFRPLAIALSLAASTLAAGAAQASIQLDTYTQDAGSRTGEIVWNAPAGSSLSNVDKSGVKIGRFTLQTHDTSTMNSAVYNSYCVDIFQYIAKNTTYGITSLGSWLGTYYDANTAATKLSQINALIANGDPLVTADKTLAADRSAAMQLAVWEIIYEYSTTGSYNAKANDFLGKGTDIASALDTANTYLGNVTKGVWKTDNSYTLSVLTSDSQQDQLIFARAPAAVPEPASWGLMIVGFGAVGAALRSRRSRERGLLLG